MAKAWEPTKLAKLNIIIKNTYVMLTLIKLIF